MSCALDLEESWSGTVATSGTLDSKRPDPLLLLAMLEEGEGDFPYSWNLEVKRSCSVPCSHLRALTVKVQRYSPVRLVGSWGRNKLLGVVHVSVVCPGRRIGPHAVLLFCSPRRVSLVFGGAALLLFGQLAFVSVVTVV